MAGGLTISTLNDSSGVLATQNGMKGIAKAWVNFNGANGSTFASYNISSVTRTSAGQYTITFATAMPSAYYTASGTAIFPTYSSNHYVAIGDINGGNGTLPSTTSCIVRTGLNAGTTLQDCGWVNVVFHGN